ncbi:MAG: recombinase family protein [Candidatus Puniceispirillaceae bacterium]
MYVGQLVWNRHRHIKHPDTGKAQLRRNAESNWTITEVPALRIIDDATFAAARKRRPGHGGGTGIRTPERGFPL